MSLRVLRFPKSSIRDEVAACVDASMAEAVGDEAWRELKRALLDLYSLEPGDIVYDQERFIESVGVLLGRHPSVVLYPLVFTQLKGAFPEALKEAESIQDVPARIESVDLTLQVQHTVMKKVSSGDHVLVLCDNLDMKEQIVRWFGKGAGEAGEMFILITGNPFGANTSGSLNIRGLVEHSYRDSSYQLSVREVFFEGYEFSHLKAIETFMGLAEESLKKGFKGIRLVMDTADLLKFGEVEGVLKLEEALGERLPFNALFLCTYDSRQFQDREALRDALVGCHSLLILPEGDSTIKAGAPP